MRTFDPYSLLAVYHTTKDEQKKYSQPAHLPAMITRVNADGTVNLTIFNDASHNDFQRNVRPGVDEGQVSCDPDILPKPAPKVTKPVAVDKGEDPTPATK